MASFYTMFSFNEITFVTGLFLGLQHHKRQQTPEFHQCNAACSVVDSREEFDILSVFYSSLSVNLRITFQQIL